MRVHERLPIVTNKMFACKPVQLFTMQSVYSIGVQNEYLVCMAWLDLLSLMAFIARNISACTHSYPILAAADTCID